MGCDIHWILEQRHPDGTWHAIHSKDQAYDLFDAAGPYPTIDDRIAARAASPAMQIGARDYVVFGLLSNVRCPAGEGGPVLAGGFPPDASDYAAAERERWGSDWHSHGHLTPAMLEGRPLSPDLRPWLDRVREVAAGQDGAPALLPRVRGEDGETWGPENPDAPQGIRASAHARADAALRGQEAKGGPWRLLVAYDN